MSGRAGSSWRTKSFLVIDVETTGLDPSRDEVISFAALPIEAGRVVAGQGVGGLVRPAVPPRASSVEIHGLREADLDAAPSAPGALLPLVSALDGRVPVAHGAWVERGFLAPHLRALGAPLPRRLLDTTLLWRLLSIERGAGDPGVISLSALAADLGLPAHRPHEAEGDALTTAQVFLALATHLESRGHGSVRALTRAGAHVQAWQLWNPRER